MPNLREKTWTTTTPANVEDAQFWEDHLIADTDFNKIASAVQSVNEITPDENGNVDIVALPPGGTAGQVLTKVSSTSGDADWQDPAESGHTIENASGTELPFQNVLQFLNAEVTNDSVNSKTVVDCQGEKGDAATIAVGTVTTLPYGSDATVTNAGTSSAAVFNFGIPQGQPGTGAPAWGSITGTLSSQTDLASALGDKADTSSLANVATSGSYNDLVDRPVIPDAQIQSDWLQVTTTAADYIKNKPEIPSVNDGVLTIQRNGTTVQTFTANQSSDTTANIVVDGWTSASTADSNMQVVFDDLDNSYGYDLYAEDMLVNIDSMTKGTGTHSGIKLTFTVSGDDIQTGTTQFKLRILK